MARYEGKRGTPSARRRIQSQRTSFGSGSQSSIAQNRSAHPMIGSGLHLSETTTVDSENMAEVENLCYR